MCSKPGIALLGAGQIRPPSISRFPRFSIIFPGIPEIGGQILKTPMVIKPSNQSKPALSLM
jgi:hypothetical protein